MLLNSPRDAEEVLVSTSARLLIKLPVKLLATSFYIKMHVYVYVINI